MSAALFFTMYFVATFMATIMSKGRRRYGSLGVVNAVFAAILVAPIILDIVGDEDCSPIENLVLLLIFGAPIYLSFMFTPVFVTVFMAVTDRVEAAVSREIRRNQRK